ncbi:MAG: MBL fold metallo-hydrolase [Gammaproteobacteria bacterium]|nr:MBL fold metallo-hydrolase [Gammaproteobacteria bacterium]NNK33295.1 MBL fold metallo-hydrolase [Xanthomonadales bacterium]
MRAFHRILALGMLIWSSSLALAAGGVVGGPNEIAPDRYVYYPGTEVLAENEIRIFACGTGMPAARHDQAASCWLIETGNGGKYIFDIGTGSMANMAALMIPYQYLDKVFLSHLHTDHMGDIDALWAGGWTAGRPNALQVWGPSGAEESMGTRYSMENFLRHVNWDRVTRNFKITPIPGNIEIHEFDYKGTNQVVYDQDGVVIRSWPAIHAGDGPVSFSLTYAGMKIVFGGDTVPNKWFMEYAQDSDVIIHESMMRPEQWVELYGQPPQLAWRACCEFHTSPQSFGKIMSELKPRHAIAYHFFNEEATRYGIYEGIRKTYDGPLSLATDRMVWNVTPDSVTERMAVIVDQAWGVPGTAVQPPPVPGQPSPMSDWISSGKWKEGYDAANEMLDGFRKDYGLEDQDWREGYWDQ